MPRIKRFLKKIKRKMVIGRGDSARKKHPSGRKGRRKRYRWQGLLLLLIAVAAVVFAVFLVSRLITALQQGDEDVETQHDEVAISEITHISFGLLSIESSEDRVSTAEFSNALQRLYDAGYVLIDVYDIIEEEADGVITFADTVYVPEGKKPLILSLRDQCYPMNSNEVGVADKLVISGGTIKAQYTSMEGTTSVGDYDFVPLLELFIGENEDFSHNGARAILGISGYCGVFGYRSTSYFASEEDNPYAAYGTYDVESEAASATEIADALKELGYRFACSGFGENISYGAEYSIVEEDLNSWLEEVAPIVGDTDIILLPRRTDIASWSGYSSDNSKYALLSQSGFAFFFVGNNSTPYLMQVGEGYLRQIVYEVSTYADFENLFGTS